MDYKLAAVCFIPPLIIVIALYFARRWWISQLERMTPEEREAEAQWDEHQRGLG